MNSNPSMFDRQMVRRNRDRAADLWNEERNGEFLFEEVVERLGERLSDVIRPFPVAVDLTARRGQLSRLLLGRSGTERVFQFDVSERFAAVAKTQNRFLATAVADEEFLPLADGSVDLIVSCLGLHWVNDLPGALIQACRALTPDGLFLAAILGGDTLTELRQAFAAAEAELEGGLGPRVAPMADVRDAGALMQRAGFALPVVDKDAITVTYEHAFALMYDLRRMGEGNALTGRRRAFSRPSTFLAAADAYVKRFADNSGRLHATFDIVYLTGWAPAEGQPRPLPPGSATTRLAEVLGVSERDPEKP